MKNGAGSSITNFLSRFYTVESRRMDGSTGKVEFIEGVLSPKGLQKLKPIPGKHGLMTIFAPTAMMGEITVTPEMVGDMLWEQCHIYPIGCRITYNSIALNGNKNTVIIENHDGLNEMLATLCHKPLIKPIRFSNDNGSRAVDISLCYDLDDMGEPIILALANMCHVDALESTHVIGTTNALIKYFRDYMNKVYIPSTRNKKLVINAQDIRTALRGVITCKSLSGLFAGQLALYL